MKTNYLVPALALLFLLIAPNVISQTYVSPSRELVQQLLNEIDKCKKDLANAEKGMAVMKKNPSEYSLETYLWVENLAKEAKECIAYNRKELDKLRDDYPGWFNSPSALAELNIRHPLFRTMQEVMADLNDMQAKIDAILARFKEFQKPEH